MPGPRPSASDEPVEPATVEPACPICGDQGWYKLDLPPGDSRFGQLQPCECRAEERLAKLASLSGLKDHEQDIRLGDLVNYDSVTNGLIRLARGFVDAPRGWLYLWGGPGNGKSLVLQAVVNELTRRGVPAIYTTFSDLLDLMRETFGDGAGESYQARFQVFHNVGGDVREKAEWGDV